MAITQDRRQLSITTPLGKDYLLLQSLRASESLSQLFRYELELRHEETEVTYEPTVVDEKKILGKPVTIRLEQGDQLERFFNGIVIQFSQGQRDTRFSYYQAVVVPQIWILTQVSQSRIFQHISVPDILRKIFAGFEVSYEIQGEFPARNYCVQYRESDWDFASRLMEEEGIYYYFEHTKGKHTLVVANTPQSHRDCPGKSTVPFALKTSGETEFISAVSGWFIEHHLHTGKFTLWDSHFQLPKKTLEATQPSRFSVGGNDDLEIYDFPGGYARKQDGIDKSGGEQASDLQKIFDDNRNIAQIRMQEIDAQHKNINGTSDCAAFTAGQRFTLSNHPARENNGQYILVTVDHNITQSPTYETDDHVEAYTNNFTCIPYGANQAPYRPPRLTPKPTVKGGQTAFVVGPAGEEIFTDKYGRVKVQFNWDRESQADADSSCWIRVAQSWAGNKWGMMFIPRVGMEVVVDFLEGDPDQPIITGCVYNAEAMPPYTLPDEKTKMTVKSDSSKGGGGFNELRFEDKKGSEQIFIHAEKDVDMRVKNDEREWVGNDHHFIVKRDRREKIERDEQRLVKRDQIEKIERDLHLKIEGKDATEIGGSLSLKVGGNVAEKFGANHSEETSASIYLKAGATIVLEASAGITLKCGGNFVTVNPGGVQIQGTMVMINSGGAALAGSPGSIVPPTPPAEADPADDNKPGSKMTLEKRSLARKERTFMQSTATDSETSDDDKDKKKSWIKLKLVDEEGKPVPGESYKVTLPDGRVASGSLNEKGEAEVKGIDPGSCKITFPNLDKDAWEEA